MIASTAALPSSAPSRIAITVVNSYATLTLCPFFGKCGGILLIDLLAGTKEFYRSPSRSSESMLQLILGLKPEGLICGFITDTERRHLQEAGIDVRIGSCSRPADKLADSFHTLPGV
ncbi:MAG: hypothetical protein AB1781_06315 [Pseudomonadota bacterium]